MLDWREAARLVESVDRRLEKLNQGDDESLLAIWGDYNAAVEKVPVVPTQVYTNQKARLNELWAQRQAAT